MLNAVWIIMVLGALVCGALTGRLDEVAVASTTSAKEAVELAIGLVGVMALWIGLMRVLQVGGLLGVIARGLQPVMKRLFPEVPPDHPALRWMILNIASNMLGLANAATAPGVKAMMELEKLNEQKDTASNSMALFLAINTSGLALMPSGVIALRASLGSHSPGSIVLTTLAATATSTLVAIFASLALSRLSPFRQPLASTVEPLPAAAPPAPATLNLDTSEVEAALAVEEGRAGPWVRTAGWGLTAVAFAAVGYGLYDRSETLISGEPLGLSGALRSAAAGWPLVIIMAVIVLYGMMRGVKVYDTVVEGGKEGFQIAVRIIPYLVAILVAVGMLRASGAVDMMTSALEPLTRLVGMPAEALPMALLRPLTGSGAYAVAADIMKAHGADSLVGQIVSTMQGSTETTFYVLAVYFGAVGVKNGRHTLAACLLADLAGVLASVWAVRLILA